MGRYDRQGHPLEPVEWLRLFDDHEYRVLRRTPVGSETVETVWVGLDVERAPDGRPCIFRTGILGQPTLFVRTPDEQAARQAHQRMVFWLDERLHPDRPPRPPTVWSGPEGEE